MHVGEARNKGKKIAMKILKVFYKVMENRKEQPKDEEEVNNSQSQNKWVKYEEKFEMMQKSRSMDKYKDNVNDEVFEIE